MPKEAKQRGSEVTKHEDIQRLAKGVCKLIMPEWDGSGFLCRIPIQNNRSIYGLLTNEHVIEKRLLQSETPVTFKALFEGFDPLKTFEITIHQKWFTGGEKLDYTFLEVRKDMFEGCEFLEVSEETEIRIGTKVLIFQFPGDEGAVISPGSVQCIKPLSHTASTDSGSSGSPIFDTESKCVIAIHTEAVEDGLEWRNEGIAIQAIRQSIERKLGRNPSLLNNQSCSQVKAIAPRYSFEPIGVPTYTGAYHNRCVEEAEIYSEVIETCNKPGKGVLVIAGEGGVGKTTLMSNLLSSELWDEQLPVSLDKTTVVLWLNCFKWQGDSLSDADKTAFDSELIELAKDCDQAFIDSLPKRIIPFFEKQGKRVLFVFDDMFNVALLQYFIKKQIHGSKLCCCVITRNPIPLKYNDIQKNVRKIMKLEALTDDGIQAMLEDFYKMKGRLQADQLRTLAKSCCGLPLIASLVRSRFGCGQEDEEQIEWGDVFKELLPSLTNIHKEKLSDFERKIYTVQQLFELTIHQLPADLRSCFYATLFFQPAEPISVNDLLIFWGSRVPLKSIIDKLKAAALIRPAGSSAANEEQIFVHQLLYEAALQKATDELHLIGESKERLDELRLRLLKGGVIVTGDHVKKTQTIEMVMFEAVRQQRLALCRRFVSEITAENLVELCHEHSAKQEDEKCSSFLHFLYHNTWRDDIIYPKGHGLEKDGVSNSYRLIAAVLLKLQKASIQPDKILKVVNKKSRSSTEWKSMLDEIFLDDNKKCQQLERNRLTWLCWGWKTVHKEQLWQHEMLSEMVEDSIIRMIIENRENEVLHKLSKMVDGIQTENASRISAEAFIAAARTGHKIILEKILQNFKEANLQMQDKKGWTAIIRAAGNGHLDVVKFIVTTDRKTVSQANNDGCTAIIAAAGNGHLDVVEFIVTTERKTVSQKDNKGSTAIMAAAVGGHLNVVEFIAAKEEAKTVSQANNDGMKLITLAALGGHLDVIKCIMKTRRASIVGDKPVLSAVKGAATGGYLDVVKFFVTAVPKANFQARNHVLLAAISMAAHSGHLDIVKFIIDTDPKTVSQADDNGWTVIMNAAEQGHLDIVKFIVATEPKAVSHADNDGGTAIMFAARNGHLDVVKFVVATEPITVDQAANDGSTAIMEAADGGYLDVVKFIVATDRKTIFQVDKLGRTVTMRAGGKGHSSVVKFIVATARGHSDVHDNNNTVDTAAMAVAQTNIEE